MDKCYYENVKGELVLKNKKITIIISTIAIILAIIIITIVLNIKRSRENSISTTNKLKEQEIEDIETIENIKNEINATANTNMYQIEEEYDGRKIIQMKPDIQYDTVIAGIIKNEKPKEEEIENLLKSRPNRNGIWISNQSKQKFIELLKKNNIENFEIDDKGYLYQKEKDNSENSKKIQKAISSQKLFVIDISGRCYERDEISGEITEYPFEEMDPSQVLEVYSIDNSSILEITTNSKKILSEKEILQDILFNIEI